METIKLDVSDDFIYDCWNMSAEELRAAILRNVDEILKEKNTFIIPNAHTILVKVGNYNRPASDQDLDDVCDEITRVLQTSNRTIVCPHTLEFIELNELDSYSVRAIKIGSDYRPASQEDLYDIEQVIKANVDNEILIMPHYVEVQEFRLTRTL